jgi:hypothetical protein
MKSPSSVNQNEHSWLNSRLLIGEEIIGSAHRRVLSRFWDFLKRPVARRTRKRGDRDVGVDRSAGILKKSENS